jgi:hypothetical protein
LRDRGSDRGASAAWTKPIPIGPRASGANTVTETAEFDPNLKGNSLETNIDNAASNSHLTNIFNQVINESDGVITTVTFDVFVPEKGRGGGSVYVGGDHGGGGFSNGTDRGPQFGF